MASAAQQLGKYLEPLTRIQRTFVMCKLEGMTDVAAATAAGIASPKKNAGHIKKSVAVQEAIAKGIAPLAQDVMFTRKKAHEMYLDAHANAANTTEQVMAITALVKLHGIAAPEVKEIHQTVRGEIEHREVRELTDEQLLRLAQLPSSELPHIIEGEYQEVEEANGSTAGGRSESREGRVEEEAAEEAEARDGAQVPQKEASG